MLGRLLRQSRFLSRSFSGGDDPYLVHLHAQPDKYPQYAHLHWHTTDPLEVGKYAKLRSKEHFGNHVADDPEPADWLPASDDKSTKLTHYQRNFLYSLVLKLQRESIDLLEDTPDMEHDEGHSLWHAVENEVLSVIKPKQMEDAVAFAQKLLGEYQAAGVSVTRQKMAEHVHLFIMSKLTPHQTSHLDHALSGYLAQVGVRNLMNDD
jgi:hypothetical protein